MSQITLERLTQEVETLTPEEQRQLCVSLDAFIAKADAEAKEQLLMQRMLEEGIISNIPTRTA